LVTSRRAASFLCKEDIGRELDMVRAKECAISSSFPAASACPGQVLAQDTRAVFQESSRPQSEGDDEPLGTALTVGRELMATAVFGGSRRHSKSNMFYSIRYRAT
jgi:hypothetical protein